MVFVVVVVGNDVFKRYYHGKLRISSIICIYPFIYTQDNVCYFSWFCGPKLWKIKKKCSYVETETGFVFFFLGFRKTSASHANI